MKLPIVPLLVALILLMVVSSAAFVVDQGEQGDPAESKADALATRRPRRGENTITLVRRLGHAGASGCAWCRTVRTRRWTVMTPSGVRTTRQRVAVTDAMFTASVPTSWLKGVAMPG